MTDERRSSLHSDAQYKAEIGARLSETYRVLNDMSTSLNAIERGLRSAWTVLQSLEDAARVAELSITDEPDASLSPECRASLRELARRAHWTAETSRALFRESSGKARAASEGIASVADAITAIAISVTRLGGTSQLLQGGQAREGCPKAE